MIHDKIDIDIFIDYISNFINILYIINKNETPNTDNCYTCY